MTIQRLEQYAAMRKEIAHLRKRVADLTDQATGRVCDTVKASSRVFPYTEHTVTVRGYSEKRVTRLNSAVRTVARREAWLARELDEIEKWLDTVPDAKTRLLIEVYYIDGKTWRAAAQQVYGQPCESAARMRVLRLFEK